MADSVSQTKTVDEHEETPEYQEMIMFYISNTVRAGLTLWCLVIISLAYIKLPPRMFGMDIPEQRIDATYSAGLLGNLLASYGISIGGMSKKKKNGEGQNGNGVSSDGQQTQPIRIEQPLIIKTETPVATKV